MDIINKNKNKSDSDSKAKRGIKTGTLTIHNELTGGRWIVDFLSQGGGGGGMLC